MTRIFKNTFFGGLVPLVWLFIAYNKNHWFFCESYSVLAGAGGIVILTNIALALLQIKSVVINTLWLAILLPSCSDNYTIDICFRLFVFACIFVLHKKIPVKKFCVAMVALLLINAGQIFFRDIASRITANKLLIHCDSNRKITFNENIYWIVCDAYTSNVVLKKYYNIDNSDFYAALQCLGFITNDKNLTYDKINNYSTLKAINTYMNFCSFDATKELPLTLHFSLKDSLLGNILNKNGYHLYMSNSRFPFLHNLNFNNFGPKNIDTISHLAYVCFRQNTIIRDFVCSALNRQLYCRQKQIFDFLSNFKQNNFNKNFYYIHIDSPHAPFILNYDGSFFDDKRSTIWGENEVGNNAYSIEDYMAMYANQTMALNDKIITILKNIISNDSNSIIILQGDHGTFMTFDKLENSSILLAIRSKHNLKCENIELLFRSLIYKN